MDHMVFLEPDKMVGTLYQDGRLEIVGLVSKDNKSRKVYAVLCHVCKDDPQLYGDGVFKVSHGNLTRNKNICCGCNSLALNKHQAAIKAVRKASEMQNKFLGFDGEYKSTKTAVFLECKIHGNWRCYSLSDFLDTKCCPKCSYEILSTKTSVRMMGNSIAKIDDQIIIDKFLSTGCFQGGTVFTRSDKVSKRNQKCYWNVFCPSCNLTNVAEYTSLSRGGLPCSCSISEQKEAYVKVLYDNEIPIAIKFGISKDANKRTFQGCKYYVETVGVWRFQDKHDCRAAETACLNKFVCGVVDREQMPLGYTETTSILNMESVISIYDDFGGVRI